MDKNLDGNNEKRLLDKIIKLLFSGDSYAEQPKEGIDLNDLPEGPAKDIVNKMLTAKKEQLKNKKSLAKKLNFFYEKMQNQETC